MSITVQTCPRCSALVMSDASECHLCHYEFQRQQSKAQPAGALPSDSAVADDMDICPKCGEPYRKGLLRCSNCSAFTRADIEAEYHKRQGTAEVHTTGHFDLPEFNASDSGVFTDVNQLYPNDSTIAIGTGEDAEFELSVSDNDFEFELDADIHLRDDHARPAAPAEATYALRTPEPTSAADELPPVLAQAAAEEAAPTPIPLAVSAGSDEKKAALAAETAVPHSEATGGDTLLEIAKAEEADVEQTKRSYRDKLRGGFIVYCPRGCRIRVADRHRGKTGQCPRCGSLFHVPLKAAPKAAGKADEVAAQEAAAPAGVYGKWSGWMADVHAHVVVPTKLKIKPDSLIKEFQAVDLAFSEEGLLVVTLVTSAGLFGANEKKKPTIRALVQDHLKSVGKVEGLPAPVQRLYPTETLRQLAMAQPVPPEVESIFGGVPVFGAARIAVRLPKLGDETAAQYLSFSLSEFRDFAQRLQAIGGPESLGGNTEVPLTEVYTKLKCHYSEQPVQELQSLPYYQADKAFTLQIAGWRCEKCSLVVSEDARKKEKIGGLNGKGIAKAKCPKCKSKFGSHPLYQVATAPVAPAATTAAAPAPEPVGAAT
jgi:ribosomal protein L40E